MNDNATPLATLLERIEDYAKTTIELLTLTIINKSADVVSSFVSRFAVITTVALSLLMINIGFALWIGKLLGDSFYGFFIVGGFYALLAVPLYFLSHRCIKYPISNAVIKQMLKQ